MSDSRNANLQADVLVGTWVAQYPETAAVFDMLQIDYCCDGEKPLEDACWANGLEVLRVHSLLKHTVAEAGNNAQPDWMHAPLTQLCDHIEQQHHALLKDSLQLLSDLMAEVVDLHSDDHKELRDVRQHVPKEESILFPRLKEAFDD